MLFKSKHRNFHIVSKRKYKKLLRKGLFVIERKQPIALKGNGSFCIISKTLMEAAFFALHKKDRNIIIVINNRRHLRKLNNMDKSIKVFSTHKQNNDAEIIATYDIFFPSYKDYLMDKLKS